MPKRAHGNNTPAAKVPKGAEPVYKDVDYMPKGSLTLKDGTVIEGISFGAETAAAGEVVFNTGMVGYPEALTDPSYKGQILVLTYPLIGNYGVPDDKLRDEFGLAKHFESDKIQITGLIVADYSHFPSHWASVKSLSDWLKEQNIPALFGIDTRALTKKLRMHGAMLGKVEFGDKTTDFVDPNTQNLVALVSRTQPQTFGHGDIRILAYDCGIKNNIIRYLVSKGVTLKVVPWDWDIEGEEFDGLFLSNGPGDPAVVEKTIATIASQYKKDKPIFGICLGNQLMALAAGAKTYKMKFGNRGMNQPCIDLRTTLCYITPQNHGFAVDVSSLSGGWKPMFVNANDWTNEGIMHETKPFFSVQFHPEAMGGPTDTEFLFDMFLDRIRTGTSMVKSVALKQPHPRVNKVLLLGSGGLSIGQAGEFDYSGSQAIKALKEERIKCILVNPNIATVQTSKGMADEVYFVPVQPDFVEQIIIQERPDAILLQFGGQTALNCGIQLEQSGVLAKYGVRVLGTQVSVIVATEDRQVFADKLAEIGETCAPSVTATNIADATKAARDLGFPVLVRAGFALGGLGSGFAHDEDSLKPLLQKAFAVATQVIVDKSLKGWKEVEYEVVRDAKDNCITVCNMENFDPLGIHTGDSIVVAPSQTLSNTEYFKLRKCALKVIRHLGVVGECNIQFALDPASTNYCIIEVNARLSRSSALASKATGYPLAYVAAKLSLDKSLTDIQNSVTKSTTACFEPSLDYMVVKFPKWEMRKFLNVSPLIGSAMKSVGEVMGIGRTFEEAFQKALRMVDGAVDGFGDLQGGFIEADGLIEEQLTNPTDKRIFAIAKAFQDGWSVDQIHDLTQIDKWFLVKLENVHLMDSRLQRCAGLGDVGVSLLRQAKQAGFSDRQIARLVNSTQVDVRALRLAVGVTPFVKQIDTLAAEFPAQTNYLYMTYNGCEHDLEFNEKGVMVLGCGAYRIGSSCEFDWCAVSCIRTLKKLGHKSIMVNYNPETVSTDYDECDRLYFEELSLERVLDIYQVESASGCVVSVGGQIPNNLAVPLSKSGVRILGTSADSIDNCEDRHRFSALLDQLHIDQPAWRSFSNLPDALAFADEVDYPVLVRPSYVLSGAAMHVCTSHADLENFMKVAVSISPAHPVVISKFIIEAKEIEYDGVAQDGFIVNYAISEHVENAGVHSGDATLLLPAQKLYVETLKRVKKTSAKIAKHLRITGPFNIQYLSKNNDIKVIECNLRASRSFPFVSKCFNTDFIELATKIMMSPPGKKVRSARIDLLDMEHVCTKVPMFSFTRLAGADPIMRVEMASTGEVAAFASTTLDGYIKGLMATNFQLPKGTIMVSAGTIDDKLELLPVIKCLKKLGYKIIGTPGTVEFCNMKGVEGVEVTHKLHSGQKPSIVDRLQVGDIDLVINLPRNDDVRALTDGYHIRRTAVDFGVGLISNCKCAHLLATAMEKLDVRAGKPFDVTTVEIKPWSWYMKESNLDREDS